MHLIWCFAFKKKITEVVLVPLYNYVSINNNKKKKIQVEIKGSRFGSENSHLIIFHYLNHIHSTFSHSLTRWLSMPHLQRLCYAPVEIVPRCRKHWFHLLYLTMCCRREGHDALLWMHTNGHLKDCIKWTEKVDPLLTCLKLGDEECMYRITELQ